MNYSDRQFDIERRRNTILNQNHLSPKIRSKQCSATFEVDQLEQELRDAYQRLHELCVQMDFNKKELGLWIEFRNLAKKMTPK